ncbi:MAG TPA: SRPBCC family protein, partial [Candidatus Dormibacteraeota bacterium]|nr:SRPBCC family protein [Candidatus Dormibacteraeota bacterium]
MAKLRESVEIEAPPERVWAVVQEDATNAPKWSSNVAKIEKLDKEPPGKGTRYRYHLDLPGGLKETLEVEQDVYNKPKK